MAKSRDYVPAGDLNFLEWVTNLTGYILANYSRWGIADPGNIFETPLGEFDAALKNARLPNAGSMDVAMKNKTRKVLETLVRIYVQGLVVRNPAVTDDDKICMALPLRDRTPTPVADPTGIAKADIAYPGRMRLQLKIKHVDDFVEKDSRVNYGCRIYYGVYDRDEKHPVDGRDLRESIFSRRKKELFTFTPSDSGKRAYFSIRYENSKGKAGPWGPLESAIIP